MSEGYQTISDAEAVYIWRTIELLTDGEGDGLNIFCPNPDFNGSLNYAIECLGYWTEWTPRRFEADRQVDCFKKALEAFNKPMPTQVERNGRVD